ncbi:uncharacterized protein LOC124155289 [Ischnura elegans]|uniref:uncharacterized protein LOC124155289 n=1 Tax=Ischnura elegans TaxID=197161 RepID=UPI001ED8B513|nr:uncharacterized protein LOC124155289 [Ischnura elegans]
MAHGVIGSLGPFEGADESWESYIERFNLFVECNDIKEEKKVSTLLTVLGVKTYNLLKDLCTPEKPSSKSFEAIVKVLQEHLSPKPSFIVERYKFSQRNQHDYETVAEYLVQLKKLSTHCEFGNRLSDYLRDRLVSGLRNEAIRKRLLGELELTFEKAVQLATSLEAADRDSSTLTYHHTAGQATSSRLQALTPRRPQHFPKQSGGQERPFRREEGIGSEKVNCFCCGKSGHTTNVCKFRSYSCHYCGKKGHLEKACICKKQSINSPSNFVCYEKPKAECSKHVQNKGTKFAKDRQHYVEEDKTDMKDDDDFDLSGVFNLQNVKMSINQVRVKPIHVNLKVEGQTLMFEVDSGACVSVISQKCYELYFNHITLQPTDLLLSSYTNEKIKPIGKLSVNVEHNNLQKTLDLFVLKTGANPLMGRDWIKAFHVTISIPMMVNQVEDDETILNYKRDSLTR